MAIECNQHLSLEQEQSLLTLQAYIRTDAYKERVRQGIDNENRQFKAAEQSMAPSHSQRTTPFTL